MYSYSAQNNGKLRLNAYNLFHQISIRSKFFFKINIRSGSILSFSEALARLAICDQWVPH